LRCRSLKSGLVLVTFLTVGLVGISQFVLLGVSSCTLEVEDCKEPSPPGPGPGPGPGPSCAPPSDQTVTASVTVIQGATVAKTVSQTVTVVSARASIQTLFTTVSGQAACPLQTPTPSNSGYLAVITFLLILLAFVLLRRRRQKGTEIKVQ
jgi:LPXTG-motif cell wall-anchored protein